MLSCVLRNFDANWRYFDVPLIFFFVTTSACRTCSHNDLQLINATFHFYDVHFYGFSILPPYHLLNSRPFLDSAQTHYCTTLNSVNFKGLYSSFSLTAHKNSDSSRGKYPYVIATPRLQSLSQRSRASIESHSTFVTVAHKHAAHTH